MAKQQTYTAAIQVTQDAARVSAITYLPGSAEVVVSYEIGDLVDGELVGSETEALSRRYADRPASLQAVFDDLEEKSLNAAAAAGLIEAGTVGDV